jgi:hypothetical protein
VVVVGVSCPFRPTRGLGEPVLEAPELELPVTEERVDCVVAEPDEVPVESLLDCVPVLVEVEGLVTEGVLEAFEEAIVDVEDNAPVVDDDAAAEEEVAALIGAKPALQLALISLKYCAGYTNQLLSGRNQRRHRRSSGKCPRRATNCRQLRSSRKHCWYIHR